MKSNKGFLNAKILAVIAGIAVVAIAAVLVFGSYGNVLARTFMSDEKYARYVAKSAVNGSLEGTVGGYYDLLDSIDPFDISAEVSSSYEITDDFIEMGQNVVNLLSFFMPGEVSSITNSVFDTLGSVKQVGLSASVSLKDKNAGANAEIKLGKTSIADGELIYDNSKNSVYVKLGDLTSKYLGAGEDVPDIKNISKLMDKYYEYQPKLKDIKKELPSKKKVNKVLTKYADLIVAELSEDNINVIKDCTVKVGDISQETTRIDYVIDNDMVERVVEKISETAEKDKDLKEVLKSLYNIYNVVNGKEEDDFDTAYDNFLDNIPEVVEELLDPILYSNISVNLGKGVSVAGLKIDNGDTVIELAMPSKGGNTNVLFTVNEYSYWKEKYVEQVAVSGTGKLKSGKISGDFKVKIEGQEALKINIDSLKMSSGKIAGKLTVELADDISGEIFGSTVSRFISDPSIEMDFDISKNSVKSSYSLFLNDKKMISAEMSGSIGKGKKISAPSDKKVIFAKDEDDINDYVKDFDMDKLISRLNKAGISEKLTDLIKIAWTGLSF